MDASEWRLDGSWLFDFGILNFSLSRSEYDDIGHKTNYSIGTFVPLIDTGEWMTFPMAGFNHNQGGIVIKDETTLENNIVMVQNTRNDGYLGTVALRPITGYWTVLAFGCGGMGSSGYSNIWLSSGVSYKLNTHHSFNLFGFISDDDFGRISKIGITYTYEFK